MIPLEKAEERAKICLDCHFGSDKPGQFVTHKMMAAGHPRISFELDLFTELQRHHEEDADYAHRKEIAGGLKLWAVGQAMALGRELALYADGVHSREGAFPEFYFFDCQSCHRAIYDDPARPLTAIANPARPIPPGSALFNDENMIMLSAAARVAAPGLTNRFEQESRAFHAAIARDPEAVDPAALALATTAARAGPGSRSARHHGAGTVFFFFGQVFRQAGDLFNSVRNSLRAAGPPLHRL